MTQQVSSVWLLKTVRINIFCALFSANLRNTTVSITEELDMNQARGTFDELYIYKEKCGEFFVIHYNWKNGTLFVRQIVLAKSGKLELISVVRQDQLINPSQTWLPFVDDEAVFYFTVDSSISLIKLPFDGTNSSNICFSNSLNDKIENINSCYSDPPVYSDGCVLFCKNRNDLLTKLKILKKILQNNVTTIFSLSMQQHRWSIITVRHHHEKSYSLLNILPDGSEFLLAGCTTCQNTSHLQQCDLSIGAAYSTSDKKLGGGGFGIVVEGKLEDQRKVAVKILHNFSVLPTAAKRQKLLSAIPEARKLKSLSHVNIVKGYGFNIENNRFLLFMELMKESVRQKILRTSVKRLEEKEAFHILQQALQGLVYLHTFKPKPIVHRDIKCANILLSENGTVKLGDLGLVRTVNLNTAGTTDYANAPIETVGTNYWQAPEVIETELTYGRKADVWSIGCSLVEILTGNPPYSNLPKFKWAADLLNGKLTYNTKKTADEIIKAAEKKAEELIKLAEKKTEESIQQMERQGNESIEVKRKKAEAIKAKISKVLEKRT